MSKNQQKPYAYTYVDDSILLPYFKIYVAFFHRFIPYQLTANFITCFSSAVMWVFLFIAFLPVHLKEPFLAIVSLLCLHTYAVGDTLDGMQAKNTGTSSPLGQFLDHYFDTYNNAITFLMVYTILNLHTPSLLYITLWIGFLTFAAVMAEEKVTGSLYFGKIGVLEGLLAFGILLLSFTYKPWLHWVQTYHFLGYHVSWIIMFVIALSYLFTYAVAIKHMPQTPRSLYAFAAVSCLLGMGLAQAHHIPVVLGFVALCAFSGNYIGKIMFSHLANTEFPRVDLVGSIAIVALFLIPKTPYAVPWLMPYMWKIITVNFVLRAVFSFIRITYYFKEHWVWYNAKPQLIES